MKEQAGSYLKKYVPTCMFHILLLTEKGIILSMSISVCYRNEEIY